MTDWRRSRAIAVVVMVVFGAIQLVVPAVGLLEDGPRRFSWQMYSVAGDAPIFMVVTGDESTEVDYDDYLAYGRVDIDVVTHLPPHLCQVVAGAERVTWAERSLEC